jgi:hypothetical protein
MRCCKMFPVELQDCAAIELSEMHRSRDRGWTVDMGYVRKVETEIGVCDVNRLPTT